MAKVRKMLGKADSPYIISIMQLIETQSKNTIVKWCNEYAREAEGNPAAQAAARAIGATTATINTVTSSLGLVFYGAAAIAYSSIGVNEKSEVYDEIAARECKNMENELRKVAVIDESNPAKIDWHC